MAGSPTLRERVFQGALGVFPAFAAHHVGLGFAGTERMLARGALGLLTPIPPRPSAAFEVIPNSLFTFAGGLGAGQQPYPRARRAWRAA